MNTGHQCSMRHRWRQRQARKWFVIHHSRREFSVGLLKKWQKWAADERNLIEYRAYGRVNTILRALQRIPQPTAAELRADSALTLTEILRRVGDAVAEKPRTYIVAGFTIALSALATSALVLHVSAPIGDSVAIQQHQYQTSSGASLDVPLEDGSSIKLSSLTRVTVCFSKKHRQVVLSAGEALFDVVHDPNRPFQVVAGATRITALGTSFGVRQYSDQHVLVAVTEGRVAVAPRKSGDPIENSPGIQPGTRQKTNAVIVTRGEEVSTNAKGQVGPPQASEHRIYRDEPIEQVIQDMQIYSARKIEYDNRLRGLRYTGIVDPTDTEEWVRGLENILPVKIDSDMQRLVIRCRTTDCTTHR